MNYPGNVFMITAPSGAGKSSLVNALLKQDSSIKLSISCTTRQPRPGEENGREYHFISVPQFNQWRTEGNMLEWAQVHDNFYGTPRHFIEQTLQQGHDVLLEIDWQGGRQVRAQLPSVTDIFILPPSYAELERRLRGRGQDSEEVIRRRLLAANQEIAHANECEYVIINGDFETALAQIQQIVSVARLRYKTQALSHSQLFAELGLNTSP